MDDAEYHAKVLAAYEGELAGVVTTAFLLEWLALDVSRTRSLRILLDVELTVASALKTVVERIGAACADFDGLAKAAKARAETIGGWDGLIAIFGPRLDAYIDKFEGLLAAARPGDEAALELLVEHERALREFGRLEVQGCGARTTERLERLLCKSPVVSDASLPVLQSINR